MKFAARINSFKQSPILKKDNQAKELSIVECLSLISSIKEVEYVELNYPEHFEQISIQEMKDLLNKFNLKLSGIALRYKTPFFNGEFNNPDVEIQDKAIQLTMDAINVCNELGGEVTTIWLANDGFDYSFQVDYNQSLDNEISALKKIVDKFPNNKISFEYKPYQPRAYSLVGDISTTLLVLDEVGSSNMGVTLDFCHLLMKKESPAYSLALAVRKNRLMGFHLNDGYKDNDDGLMLGSVHLMQTLEFIYYAKKYQYEGITYFDTFPIRENPIKECIQNIKMYKLLDQYIDDIGLDKINRLIQEHDAIKSQQLLIDILSKK
jgi:Predicted sugar isomerase